MNQQNDNTIINVATHAETALAAYATNLPEGNNIVPQLKDAGMTEAQADAFAETYTVVEQFDSYTGSSATIFENAAGERILSVRGTQPLDLRDLDADGLIGAGVPAAANPQYMAVSAKVAEWIADGTLPANFTVDGKEP